MVAVGNTAQQINALVAQCVTCLGRGDFASALQLGQRIFALDPNRGEGPHVIGTALLRQNRATQALPWLKKASQAKPLDGTIMWLMGQALLAASDPVQAVGCFEKARELGVQDLQLDFNLYEAALAAVHAPDWSPWSDERIPRLLRQAVMSTAFRVFNTGESMLTLPQFSNPVLRRSAENHARAVLASLGSVTPFAYKPPGSRIRLGFLGCDFYDQATAYLMTGFIEAMDRTQFELFAYDHGGPKPDTGFRRRVIAAYDHFVDIATLSDEQAAQRIHDDGIDVLLSIKNPASARLGLLARRPAAVQIHYLYYPATSGMPFMDYIIGDAVVIPPGAEGAYTEKVLRLPGCYQPNDQLRVLPADSGHQRWGLPDGAVVMANFNQAYKITPALFDLWCQLLSRDARRLLWLLVEDSTTQARLRREARARGIAPERIQFTPRATMPEHLDRLRFCDVMVDTYPCGGHTLTSDTLWAGTPMVTLCGETFASRVAASLLLDVGMGELVACNEQEYLDKAEALLNDQEARLRWRRHLDEGRGQFALFDPVAYARKFEQAMLSVVATTGSQ